MIAQQMDEKILKFLKSSKKLQVCIRKLIYVKELMLNNYLFSMIKCCSLDRMFISIVKVLWHVHDLIINKTICTIHHHLIY
jgi:hypothetical protein